MTTNTYQSLCYDVGAYNDDKCRLDRSWDDCYLWTLQENGCKFCENNKRGGYPPQSAEQRERIFCLALNTYRYMLADINDIEIMTPENLFTTSLEWIQIGLKESVLSKEEVKDCLIAK